MLAERIFSGGKNNRIIAYKILAFSIAASFWNIQDDRKVMQPTADTCSVLQKVNQTTKLIKNNAILSVSSLNTKYQPEQFLSCTFPVSRKPFPRRDIVDLFATGESRNVSLNSLYQAG
jgi:hypothetical protein